MRSLCLGEDKDGANYVCEQAEKETRFLHWKETAQVIFRVVLLEITSLSYEDDLHDFSMA